MGFLDFWRQQPGDDQGDLLQQESGKIIDASEPSRRIVHKQLHDEVKKRGGSAKTHAAINHIANETMLSETTEDLYKGLGLKQGDRSKLPAEAKEALMTGDIAARYQIVEDDAKGHRPIVKSSGKAYRKASGLFFWNK